MDPTACYSHLCQALINRRYADAVSHAHDLYRWLQGGGFPPNAVRIPVHMYIEPPILPHGTTLRTLCQFINSRIPIQETHS